MTDSSKLRLDLPLILPDVDDVEDHCVQRLTEALEGRPGISEAHIVRDADGQPQLCLHYDQSVVSITRLRELVGSVGAQLSERFSHLTIRAMARFMHAQRAALPPICEVFQAFWKQMCRAPAPSVLNTTANWCRRRH